MVISKIEQLLIDKGYNALSLYEKNQVIVMLSEKNGIQHNEVTEEMILEHHKTLKSSILSDECESDIVKGFTSQLNNHVYRTNRDDQINLIGQKDVLMADETIETVMWKTEDVGYVEHTREDWLSIYMEAFNVKKEKLFKYNTLKHRILTATTHEEIVAVDWHEKEEEEVEGTV